MWSPAESLFICKQGDFEAVVIILNGLSQGNAFDHSRQHTITTFIAPLMSLCCTDRSDVPPWLQVRALTKVSLLSVHRSHFSTIMGPLLQAMIKQAEKYRPGSASVGKVG